VKVEQLMTRDVKICTEADTLNRAAELMWDCDCGCIPVMGTNGDGGLVGLVTDPRAPREVAVTA
jgi:CBS domain-containing protein